MYGKCIFNEMYECIFLMILLHVSHVLYTNINIQRDLKPQKYSYLINMKILDISSHILIINESFWKLEILIRCSLTVTSVGCFRMPSSSLKHTGPTHDTCLVNALMGWVPWWTRPYRTAHASPLKRGKHAQCDRHCETLLDELSVRHIIWNITASTDLYLYIVICLCLYELHIVSVYIWYLSNFDCKLKFHLSSV